ncbi:MAG: hypothetical protein ACO2ZM_09950, partial [Francisellaceae bacterium]
GTGFSGISRRKRKKNAKEAVNWGKIDWLSHGIIDDLMMGNTTISKYQSALLLGDNYYRINPDLDGAGCDLDDIDKDNVESLVKVADNAFARHREELLQFYQAVL